MVCVCVRFLFHKISVDHFVFSYRVFFLENSTYVGYEGVFCQINTDDCASQPCLNNGKCIDKINSFHCECPKGNCF